MSGTGSTYVVPTSKLASYRPDIDGLRAIAVLSVVLFHSFPDVLPGGFTGVDVFFVISGYLISGLIFRHLDEGTFRVTDFYSRRIRRIFPALALVLAATFGMGWVVLFAEELTRLSSHILSGIGFAANFQLWQEAGYFDSSAETKPLLHLWSLGIEEQFYLIFPILLVLLSRVRWNRRYAVIVLLVSSFLLNLALHVDDPTATFYSPSTRFWEPLLGALLALKIHLFPQEGGSRRAATVISLGGLGLIVAGALLTTKAAPFPGWRALLPTLGAMLTIGAGMMSAINMRVLAHPILRWFGGISYPLYLWHWPLLVYARILASGTPPVLTRTTLVVLSVVLAWATSRIVENPLRFGGRNRPKVAVLVSAMVVLALTSWQVVRADGYAGRHVNMVGHFAPTSLSRSAANIAPGCGIESPEDAGKLSVCVHDTRNTPSIALVGDSKAEALSVGLLSNSRPGSRLLVMGGFGGASAPLPVVTDDARYAKFQPVFRVAADAVRRNPAIKVVIITAATRHLYQLTNQTDINDLPLTPLQSLVVEGMDRAITPLVAAKKKVILTVDNPTLPYPEECVSRGFSVGPLDGLLAVGSKICSISRTEHLRLSANYRAALNEVAARHPDSVRVFDTLPILIDKDGAHFRTMQDGQLYYSFTDHISPYAADLIGRKLIPFAEEFGGLDGATAPEMAGDRAELR